MRIIAEIGDIWTRIVTDSGDFYVGAAGADTITMDATVVGLAGMAGDDRLNGSAGRDYLFGDYFSAELFSETSTTVPEYDYTIIGNDKLFGRAGRDFLIAGPGNDSLYGGSGNDLYLLQGGGRDRLFEASDAGIDTVSTDRSTYTLAANFENLEFSNLFSELRKDVHGVGNTLSNVIIGGFRNDTLEGLGGNDTIAGSNGRDVLVGGAGRDSFAFGFGARENGVLSKGVNADTISDFNAAADQILLDFFSFDAGLNRPPQEGVIREARFGLAGASLTGSEVVVYDQATGNIMTRDGDVFAHVLAGTVLTYQDFEWSYGNWM